MKTLKRILATILIVVTLLPLFILQCILATPSLVFDLDKYIVIPYLWEYTEFLVRLIK